MVDKYTKMCGRSRYYLFFKVTRAALELVIYHFFKEAHHVSRPLTITARREILSEGPTACIWMLFMTLQHTLIRMPWFNLSIVKMNSALSATWLTAMKSSKEKNIYIGDRGYCSYNNMAHVLEQNQFFLFRTKDIHSKALVGNFDFPEEEVFDIDVKVTLVRSHSRKIPVNPGTYRRFVDRASTFDYVAYGSSDTYELAFRIIRFPLSESACECIITNLPRDEFPPERIKKLYYARWGIESSFR